MTESERFWSKVDKSGSCWVWLGYKRAKGYGEFRSSDPRRSKLAHRWSYEEAFGPIAAGLQIDHKCRNPACVRPHHLSAVTARANALRGSSFGAVNARKTHCPRGHPYDVANTYRHPDGRRQCRACMRIHRAKYRDAKRAAR